MRKNFVLYILIPLLIAGVIVYLFIDRWVESGLESAGEALVGARVEIDNLSVTVAPVGIRWARMQVANPGDPWKNLFETGKIAFAIDLGQLLRNKYLIETMEVNELLLGTKRTTDGSLPEGRKRTETQSSSFFTDLARQAVDKAVEQTPVFSLENLRSGINADSLVRSLDLRTLRHIETLKVQIASTSKQWDAIVADVDSSKRRLAEVETKIRAINPAELKTVDKIVGAITTVDNTIIAINDLKKTLDNRKTAVTGEIARLGGSVGQVSDIVRADFDRLLAMARLPNLNTAGIARLLAGQEIYKRAMTYLGYVDFARSNIKKYTPEPAYETPPRFRGQNIHFPVGQHCPKLWIRSVVISGGTGQLRDDDFVRAEGEAHNITNDQTVTGAPMTIDLRGVEGGGRSFTLGALIDRRKDVPFDEYRGSLGGVPLAEFRIGRDDFLPTRIVNARMTSSVVISVPGDRFDARTKIDLSDFKVVFDVASRNLVERLLMDVLREIRGFDVGLRLWNTGGTFDVALTTNLDDQFAQRVKSVLGAEVTKLQNDLRAKLDEVVGRKRKELEQLFAARKADLESRLQSYESILNEKLQLLETKKHELTAQLEKEKKGKVEDLLKKIIK